MKKQLWGAVVAAIGLCLLASWLVIDGTGRVQRDIHYRRLQVAAADLQSHYFTRHRAELEWLALQPSVREFLINTKEHSTEVSFLLDEARGLLGLEVVYLVSTRGLVVASTEPDFLRTDVSERDYFRRGMSGLPSYAMAVGLVTRSRGLYASVPVYHSGQVVGLAVFRTAATTLDAWQSGLPELLIVQPDGVVFSSVDPRIPAGSSLLSPDRIQRLSDGTVVGVLRAPLEVVPGFSLVSLAPVIWPWPLLAATNAAVLLLMAMGLLAVRHYRLSRERRLQGLQRQQQEALLSHLMEGIAVFDEHEHLTWSNPAFDRLIERDPDGRAPTMSELWDRSGPGPWRDVLEGRRPWVVFESVLRGRQGAWIPVSAGFTEAEGRYLLSVLDGSERYRSDQLLRQSQKLTVLGQLSGGIAHDLNNMLGVLMGMADLLKVSLPEQDPLQESVELILTTLTRAAGLSERMLNFARQTPIRRVSLDFAALMRELKFLARTALPEGIEAQVSAPVEPAVIEGDESLLLSAFLNLVLNAAEAMPEGGVVRVLCSTVDARLVAEVSDTGVGMDKVTLARIYEPFFSTKLDRKGTGLGLSLVRRTILEHRGTIDVRSEPGVGTTVKITLPLVNERLAPR